MSTPNESSPNRLLEASSRLVRSHLATENALNIVLHNLTNSRTRHQHKTVFTERLTSLSKALREAFHYQWFNAANNIQIGSPLMLPSPKPKSLAELLAGLHRVINMLGDEMASDPRELKSSVNLLREAVEQMVTTFGQAVKEVLFNCGRDHLQWVQDSSANEVAEWAYQDYVNAWINVYEPVAESVDESP